eukprot:TRINITY_DN1580_c0_g1_i1.p1 TRINITY_DN1580_c0_g1~~TRINITY_DN1580_c0_g1_i1.p1  ORF type:complete len:114 (-),score=5.39 TRINITY_DN1580_c0_g1_i1:323-664(-)
MKKISKIYAFKSTKINHYPIYNVSKIKFVNALRLTIEKLLVKNESSKQLKEIEVSMLERVLVPSPSRVPLEKQRANILCTRAAVLACPLDYKKCTSNSLKEGNAFLCNVDFKA